LEDKSYVGSNSDFKLENHLHYQLTITPWVAINKSYKSSINKFINQYSVISQAEPSAAPVKRSYRKRQLEYDLYDSNNEERGVRTRRKPIKELSSDDELALVSSPKRAKKPKPSSPSLALQQQSLIDESIPDFSPNAQETLPENNTKCLRIEWKGQPMDLSEDANLSKLHPAEVVLASILRLPVSVYLDSKRRLFYEKVARLKADKQFRRTDAQKACRIDVNKASRLFAAFEKVGWLNDEHFEKYINDV
jgi:hypothetical protein